MINYYEHMRRCGKSPWLSCLSLVLTLALGPGCIGTTADIGADGAVVCSSPQMVCVGACVDPASDNLNCGGCNTICGRGFMCQNGSCVGVCLDGMGTACGGLCVDTATDNQNCGACDQPCGAGLVCSAGTCQATCAEPYVTCGEKEDRYCAATAQDPKNCGSCGHECPENYVCQESECQSACTGLQGTLCGGHCVSTNTDNQNCGKCGQPCGAGLVCSGGTCQPTCAEPYVACGAGCADTQNDPRNCGSCGHLCDSGYVCQTGECRGACSGSMGTFCDGSGCVDLATDNLNCGACGHYCPQKAFCSFGGCTCETPFSLCTVGETSLCVDTQTNYAHCGGCNQPCGGEQACVAGNCEYVALWIAMTLRFEEEFPSAFMVRNVATTPEAPTAMGEQNVPGLIYNTETGFYSRAWGGSAPDGGTVSADAGTIDAGALAQAGFVESGTRLMAQFNNVQQGVRLFIPLAETGRPTGSSSATRLVSTDASGAGLYTPAPATNSCPELAELEVQGGTARAVWEVVKANMWGYDWFEYDIFAAYVSNPANNLPLPGTMTVTGSLAPAVDYSNTLWNQASATLPVPRFVITTNPQNGFTIEH